MLNPHTVDAVEAPALKPLKPTEPRRPPLTFRSTLLLGTIAATAFHLAQYRPGLNGLLLLFAYAVYRLSETVTARWAFYSGLALGFALYIPHLAFFARIFGPAALVLWSIPALWLALFLALTWNLRQRWGALAAALLTPLIWTGIEYFRSELYPLRFSWLSLGYTFAPTPRVFWLAPLGVYGVGFGVMAWATLGSLFSRWGSLRWTALGIILLTTISHWPAPAGAPPTSSSGVRITGIQLEFPTHDEVLSALNHALASHPDTELFVMSEYTFHGPVPDSILDWCREHRRHLIVGGKAPIEGGDFYNTTFVVGPNGDTVFQQAKSVPIQFFADGQPAPERRLWSSPWGRIGFAICYDLSYRRVVDDVVRQGAQALIVPAMDVADWGAYEHALHARVAQVRAAEYGLPIFRVASSGISQHVDPHGHVLAAIPFPDQGELLSATLRMEDRGRVPWDAPLAPLATGATVVCGLLLLVWRRQGHSTSNAED